MIRPDVYIGYNLEVSPDTRNHRGYFVRNTTYKLIGIEPSGWALICENDTICHYVDPDCLKERKHRKRRSHDQFSQADLINGIAGLTG